MKTYVALFSFFLFLYYHNSGNKPKISLLRKGKRCWCSEKLGKGRKGDRNFPHRCIKIHHSVQTWRDSSELGRQWNMKLYRIQQLSECHLSWTANMNLFNIVHHSRKITVIIHRSLFPIFGYQLVFWNTTNQYNENQYTIFSFFRLFKICIFKLSWFILRIVLYPYNLLL